MNLNIFKKILNFMFEFLIFIEVKTVQTHFPKFF